MFVSHKSVFGSRGPVETHLKRGQPGGSGAPFPATLDEPRHRPHGSVHIHSSPPYQSPLMM